VSATVAEERLELQRDGSAMVEMLEGVEGEAYAGVWFDNSTGQFVVPLSHPVLRPEVESALTAAGLEDGSYRVASSEYSWQELQETQAAVDIHLSPLFGKQVVRTALDPRTNSVVIYQAHGASGAQREVIDDLGESSAVEVRQNRANLFKSAPASCNDAIKSCGLPLRGGVAIENGPSRCTAGFTAEDKATHQHVLLTAGHCVSSSPGSAWHAYTETGEARQLGTSQSYAFPGHDWADIAASGSAWNSPWASEVVLWGTEEARPITSEGPSYLGEQVCHVGVTSGVSCGTVTRLNKTFHYVGGATVNT
jgi:hypothetical protein